MRGSSPCMTRSMGADMAAQAYSAYAPPRRRAEGLSSVHSRASGHPGYHSAAPPCAETLRQAHAYYRAGNFKDAEALLRDAVARRPGDSELWNLRGVVLAAMRRYIDALWSYRSALALDPNRSATWTNPGHALQTLKQ